VKTSELIGPALDWAVAKCEGVEVEYINDGRTKCLLRVSPFTGVYRPSTDWSQSGPIIDWECMEFDYDEGDQIYRAYNGITGGQGNTHLIAAMRCFVSSHLGDEIEIPEELL
jgi:hypothetical protein